MDNPLMKVFALVCMAGFITMLLAGLFHSRYKDNLLQCIGMCGMLIWAGNETTYILSAHYRVTGFDLMLYVSLLAFSIGVLKKVLQYIEKHSPVTPPPTGPQEFNVQPQRNDLK